MGLLTDTELRKAIGTTPSRLIEGISPNDLQTEVYGCAVYLHIGEIYLPGTDPTWVGSASKPIQLQHCLAEGETAVIRTKESFVLDARHAGLVVPSSSVSMQGLLMTNPGHVDPGYVGQLHVTVINMGQKPYPLVPGGRFLRALIFKLDDVVSSPFRSAKRDPITDELLGRLARDFLSVDNRTKAVAKKEIDSAVRANTWAQYGVPALFAVVGALASGFYTNFSASRDFEQRITTLQKIDADRRIAALEYRYPTEQQIKQMELELDRLKRGTKQ